ncbi:MAG TPA: YbdK family carboxylate-amine ligase, partial [Burkholderiaceae bacterium]
LDAAKQLELDLCGGGTHPFQQWSQQRLDGTPRLHRISELYGDMARQQTLFGQHVHVGCPGPDQALVLMHGLSRFVPHLIALSASSPFVQGIDTGFASARLNSTLALPLSGRAPFLTRWDEFEAYFAKMAHTGVVSDFNDIHWDIRPKPEFGTIEVRVCDTPLTLDKAAALAAYVQCLARWLRVEHPFELRADDDLPYAFNRFQACRFGLDATYVDPGTGEHRALREEIRASFDLLEVHAMELRAEDALIFLRSEFNSTGNDAAWLRDLHGRESMLSEVVRQQARRWAGLDQ